MQAPRSQALGPHRWQGRVDRGRGHHHAARAQLCGQALFPKQHVFGLRGIDHQDQYHVAVRRQFGRRGHSLTAGLLQGSPDFGTGVAAPDGHAASQGRQGGTQAHGAQADHAQGSGEIRHVDTVE